MRNLRFALEARAARGALWAAGYVPRSVARRCGAAAGLLAWTLLRGRRRLTVDQLRLAFGPALDTARARRIGRACWRNVGIHLMESLWLSRRRFAPADAIVAWEGLEHLRRAYARGRGVLQFTGHFGHWELAAAAQARLGLPLALVARRMDNPALERLMLQLREVAGNRIVYKDRAARDMLRALGDGGGVALVIDQDARGDGVFVPFFGRLASTTPALARLALRTDAAVVPTFCVPRADGTYVVTCEPALETVRTADREADVLELTARCTAVLERWVRAHPDCWWWMHRRWKTPPPGPAARPGAAAESGR